MKEHEKSWWSGRQLSDFIVEGADEKRTFTCEWIQRMMHFQSCSIDTASSIAKAAVVIAGIALILAIYGLIR